MPSLYHPESGRRIIVEQRALLFGNEPTFVDAETKHIVFRKYVDTERWASVNAAACKRVEREASALGRALKERPDREDQAIGAALLDMTLLVAERRRKFLERTRGTV